MRRLTVSVGQDHLLRLVRSPRQGLFELVWNALDADATKIRITLDQDTLGAIQSIRVEDDGTGITAEQAERQFDKLGNSWKHVARISDAGRPFHGQLGRGRWAAFGIGQEARWDSRAVHVTGEVQGLKIHGSRNSLASFDYDGPVVAADQQTGTTVTVASLLPNAQKYFQSTDPFVDLTTEFATYVENYDIEIDYDGSIIDPQSMQLGSTELLIEVPTAIPKRVELRIIEWNQAVNRSLYFIDSNGAILHAMKPGIQAPTFDFTAYAKWAGARDRQAELALEDMAPEPIPDVIKAIKKAMRKHFADRDKNQRATLVNAWKKEDSYPYKVEPVTEVERAERELFDVVAVTAAKSLNPMEVRERKLSFALIQQGLSQNPQAVRVILRDVLDMPDRKLKELTALLERTSLSSVVSMAKTVADRMDFVRGLEHLVFEKQTKKKLLERSQLHKILANETWILREEYALSTNDETLTSALRDHLGEFGAEGVAMEDALDSEVLDAEGKRVVVDLILSSVVPQSVRSREHVVIELKRPTVHINASGLLQANKYAVAVKNDPRFEKVDVKWEFWIVGDQITDDANNLLDDQGIFAMSGKEGNIPVRAVTWAQIIEDAKHRLKFVERALEIRPSTESGIEYLKSHYPEFLPEVSDEEEDVEEVATADAVDDTSGGGVVVAPASTGASDSGDEAGGDEAGGELMGSGGTGPQVSSAGN